MKQSFEVQINLKKKLLQVSSNLEQLFPNSKGLHSPISDVKKKNEGNEKFFHRKHL